MNKRLAILISSALIAIIVIWGLSQASWTPTSAYLIYAALAVFFLGMLVSNQQYEEDIFSKIERTVSAFLLSYVIFFRFFYAPLSQFFFGSLITKSSFVADLLSLVLFAIFFVLFGTAFLVLNAYARSGFLSHWRIFNNEKAFFVLRGLFFAAVMIFSLLYLRNSFFSISRSYYMNKILPPATCNWTYIKYPNFLMMSRTIAGRDVCLYNYAQDQYDSKYCSLIKDNETREICNEYFASEAEN